MLCDVNHQGQAMSELCVGPLCHGEPPKIHFQAAGFLLHNKEKSFIFIFMPKNLVWTQPQVDLNVTITSKVVVYAPAERAEKLLRFLLYPRFLCGCRQKVQKSQTENSR
jgi:hypothetical protein